VAVMPAGVKMKRSTYISNGTFARRSMMAPSTM